ncbi:VQ motif protein [Rhynchospora pubera]|uniref:VQ motif protein n=1 Tax=Rhynchospora pubera TaxID=906938 RepID=A0AAV8DFE2_9POAL|nr:VQ motif protein [Rhynchospora pubera]
MEPNPNPPNSPPHSTTSSATNTTTTTTSNPQTQSSLRSLNKSSYKISKPTTTNRLSSPPPPPTPSEPNTNPNPNPSISASNLSGPAAPPQPPVYNIDKNNFREIVQKLTGSIAPVTPRPAAPPVSIPPVPPPPQPSSSSRLHRIRPPPLANLSARPPSVSSQPALSPLPPLPAVGVTAESPISAYMRRLHNTGMEPLSPLGFGCLQSPQTAYQMMMMSSAGLPTSPGVPPLPAPSPRGER